MGKQKNGRKKRINCSRFIEYLRVYISFGLTFYSRIFVSMPSGASDDRVIPDIVSNFWNIVEARERDTPPLCSQPIDGVQRKGNVSRSEPVHGTTSLSGNPWQASRAPIPFPVSTAMLAKETTYLRSCFTLR